MKTIKTTLTVLVVAAAGLVSLTAGAAINDAQRAGGAAWELPRVHEIAYMPVRSGVEEVYQMRPDGTLQDTGQKAMLFVNDISQ